MSDLSKVFVGLDVHKDSISIGVAQAGQQPARFVGKIVHDVPKLLKQLERIAQAADILIVYEAGPTGYGLQRALTARGYTGQIIAPSLIPRRPGERVKTDRRDCLRLAELARAGELKAIWIPQPEDEAIRNLARAREDAVNLRTQARHQLKAFLLRGGVAYSGKTTWTKTHARWLATLSFAHASDQIAFTEYCQAVSSADERVQRLTSALSQAIAGWRFESVVRALQALRGIDEVAAIGLVAEIGDIGRFAHPRQLMGYLGLVPSEASSGDRVRKGDALPRRPIGPHTTQTFTSEWRAYLFTVWGASNYDMASSSTERAGWLPEMTKDFEGGKVDPARTDGLYTGPSRGHTIPKYAQLIGMPRGYGYGASMGAWFIDYLANWAGEWAFVRHSDMKYRGPALTGDVTYLDGEVTEVNHDERDVLVARVEVHMTSQRGTRLADGTAEVELPRE